VQDRVIHALGMFLDFRKASKVSESLENPACMDHAILHGKPFGIFLYFKYNKALSDDNGMGGFTGGSHPLRLGVQGGAKGVQGGATLTLQDTLSTRFRRSTITRRILIQFLSNVC
jgi:hypothetical protein